MEADEVIRFVNRGRLTYKKGWSFRAEPGGLWPMQAGDGNVIVRIEARVPNSSPPNVDARPFVFTSMDVIVRPGPRDYVIRQLFDGIARMEEHESREFFRIDGNAPFHPHRDDGVQAWADRA